MRPQISHYKIQLGWRYHASTAEERNPSGSRKTTSVWITASLQCTDRRWRSAHDWQQTFLITAVVKNFIPKNTFAVADVITQHAGVPFSFLLNVFFGLASLARSQWSKQCEDHMPSATVGQINSLNNWNSIQRGLICEYQIQLNTSDHSFSGLFAITFNVLQHPGKTPPLKTVQPKGM